MNTGDLFDNLTGRVQIDQPLVNPHFISIPSLRTLTIGSLSGGDFENLSGQANRSLYFEILILGSGNQIGTDCMNESIFNSSGSITFLDIFDVTRGERDSDSVDLDSCLGLLFFFSSFSD
jgi:hypothetical protein